MPGTAGKIRRYALVAHLIALAWLSSAIYGFAARSQVDPVKITFQQLLPASMEKIKGDTVTSSGDPYYAPYVNGQQDVSAILQTGGNLGLDTDKSTKDPAFRQLWLDFTDPVTTGTMPGTSPPFTEPQPVTAYLVCNGYTVNLRDMSPGQEQSASIEIRFVVDDTQWYVRFNTNAGNTPVKVTRGDGQLIGPDGQILGMNTWLVETYSSPEFDLARLWSKPVKSSPTSPQTDHGLFHMPFRFVIDKL